MSLEDENRKLKKLLAKSVHDAATLREIARKKLLRPGLRRKAVTWAIREKSYSQRRACRLVGPAPQDRYRYASQRSDDTALRTKLRELASQRRRFGYRRLGLLLARQGIKLNHKKLYRLYKEERLTCAGAVVRKRALGTRAPMTIPQGPNLRWSIDFMADTLAARPALPYPDLVDDFTRDMSWPGGGHLTHWPTCCPRTRSHR